MMSSWKDLTTEIHLLIVRSYINFVLFELDDYKYDEEWSHHLRRSTTRKVNQILDLAIALPSLRKEIIKHCAILEP